MMKTRSQPAATDLSLRSRASVSTVLLLLAAGFVLAIMATPATAAGYRILLHNGNEFVSKYQPVEAHFDPNIVLIMTDVGNIISLSRDDVSEITHDLEVRGFGRVIDTTTIEVGWSPNDAPVEGAEGAEGELQPGQMMGGAAMQQMMLEQLNAPPPVFNNPLVGEPNSGGGIPVGMATSGYVPISNN